MTLFTEETQAEVCGNMPEIMGWSWDRRQMGQFWTFCVEDESRPSRARCPGQLLRRDVWVGRPSALRQQLAP